MVREIPGWARLRLMVVCTRVSCMPEIRFDEDVAEVVHGSCAWKLEHGLVGRGTSE